jgi:hypothetical protein
MTVPEGGDDALAPALSRAFEALVQGADDVVGLLAYATYTQSIREAALAGQGVADRQSRNLPPAMVTALRSSAEQILTKIVSDGITQATPDIQNTATIATLNINRADVLNALQHERQRIEAHVTTRTRFLSTFLTNLLAWVATLIIAVAILYLANRPSVESTLSKSIGEPAVEQPLARALPPSQAAPTKERPHDTGH